MLQPYLRNSKKQSLCVVAKLQTCKLRASSSYYYYPTYYYNYYPLT